MPEVTISIGGRNFEVACQEGEEHYLHSAAKMLDTEAQTLASQIGRIPEARMLLMAGLMLADKTSGVQEQMVKLQEKLAAQERLIEELRANAQGGEALDTSLEELALLQSELEEIKTHSQEQVERLKQQVEETNLELQIKEREMKKIKFMQLISTRNQDDQRPLERLRTIDNGSLVGRFPKN